MAWFSDAGWSDATCFVVALILAFGCLLRLIVAWHNRPLRVSQRRRRAARDVQLNPMFGRDWKDSP